MIENQKTLRIYANHLSDLGIRLIFRGLESGNLGLRREGVEMCAESVRIYREFLNNDTFHSISPTKNGL